MGKLALMSLPPATSCFPIPFSFPLLFLIYLTLVYQIVKKKYIGAITPAYQCQDFAQIRPLTACKIKMSKINIQTLFD